MATTKRMTGIDYRREWNLLQQAEKSLKAYVQERLIELIKKYPEAEIEFETKASSIKYIEIMSSVVMITYIEKIEKWSADQQKVEQLYLEIPNEIKKTLKKLSE